MLDALKKSINDLYKTHRPRLEDECDALYTRIEQARREGLVTDEQATQLIYDVRNERSRCFRSGIRRRVGEPAADGFSTEDPLAPQPSP